jgi:hypothetical protein
MKRKPVYLKTSLFELYKVAEQLQNEWFEENGCDQDLDKDIAFNLHLEPDKNAKNMFVIKRETQKKNLVVNRRPIGYKKIDYIG